MKTLERKESVEFRTLDETLPDLSQHPIVLKKVEKARATLEKHPIPDNLFKKRN